METTLDRMGGPRVLGVSPGLVALGVRDVVGSSDGRADGYSTIGSPMINDLAEIAVGTSTPSELAAAATASVNDPDATILLRVLVRLATKLTGSADSPSCRVGITTSKVIVAEYPAGLVEGVPEGARDGSAA